MADRRTRDFPQAATSRMLHGVESNGQLTTAGAPGSDTNTTSDPSVGTVVSRIEGILEAVTDSLQAREPLSIDFRSRRNSDRSPSERREERIQFPGRTVQEARKFGTMAWDVLQCFANCFAARVLLILQLSHDAVVSGTVLTKRYGSIPSTCHHQRFMY